MAFVLRDDFPPNTPGSVCSLCHAALRRRPEPDGPREAVVDPQVTTGDPDRPGHFPLAICESCAVEMGRLVGMAPRTDVEAAHAELFAIRAGLDNATAENDALREAITTLQAIGFGTTEAAPDHHKESAHA